MKTIYIVATLILTAYTVQTTRNNVRANSSAKSCYFESDSVMNWNEAAEFCWRHNGYLVEVTTAAEEYQIYEWLNKDLTYWIGLSERTEEGVWRWEQSHQIADYLNWYPGEPNDFDGDEDCVWMVWVVEEIQHSSWYDAPCDSYGIGWNPHALCETECS